jgi:aryl-alcohol dehydrogenase-like predicted oxidoreductase
MKYRKLGSSGIKVSEICLGTMQFILYVDEEGSQAVLDAFEEGGGNFIDTANIYSNWGKGLKGGEAEGVIGDWMRRKHNRRNVVLATKARGRMWEGPLGEGLSRKHLIQACDESLERLQTDYIDLYQSHWDDRSVPIEETLAAFDTLIKQGKVRHAGCSNYNPALFGEALALGRTPGLAPYISYQPYYNIVDRGFEKDHLALCQKYNVAVIPYSPLAAGFLTERYQKGKALPKSANRSDDVKKRFFNEHGWRVHAALSKIAKKRRKTIGQTALAWLLGHEWMTAPIVGGNNVEQIKQNMAASDFRLSEAEKMELDKVSTKE